MLPMDEIPSLEARLASALEELREERERRQKAETALAEKSTEFDLISKSTGADFWEFDLRSHEVRYQSRWAEYLGYPPQSIPDNLENCLSQIHPDDLPRLIMAIRGYENGVADHSEEYRIRRFDGTWAEILIRGRISGYDTDGRPRMLVGIALDVSEIKRLERSCIESEERYRLLFESMNTGLALHEMLYDDTGKPYDYRYLKVNKAFEQMIGIAAEKIIGKTAKELFPGTESYWVETYAEVVRSGKSCEFRNFSRALGKHFHVYAYSPSVGTFATVIIDSTDRVESRMLLERTIEQKDLLIQEIYHRTRNNLQIISALLSIKAAQAKDPDLNETYRSMEKRIQAMALVQQVLYEGMDLSYIDMSIYATKLSEVFADRIGTAQKLNLRLNLEKGLRLEIDEALPCAQVLFEAVSNAVEHGLKGKAEGTIDIGMRVLENGEVGINVSDNGWGPPAGFDISKNRGLGLLLIENLCTSQLMGQVAFTFTPGFCIEAHFPRGRYKERI